MFSTSVHVVIHRRDAVVRGPSTFRNRGNRELVERVGCRCFSYESNSTSPHGECSREDLRRRYSSSHRSGVVCFCASFLPVQPSCIYGRQQAWVRLPLHPH